MGRYYSISIQVLPEANDKLPEGLILAYTKLLRRMGKILKICDFWKNQDIEMNRALT